MFKRLNSTQWAALINGLIVLTVVSIGIIGNINVEVDHRENININTPDGFLNVYHSGMGAATRIENWLDDRPFSRRARQFNHDGLVVEGGKSIPPDITVAPPVPEGWTVRFEKEESPDSVGFRTILIPTQSIPFKGTPFKDTLIHWYDGTIDTLSAKS